MYQRLTDVKPVISTVRIVQEQRYKIKDVGERIRRYQDNRMKVDPLIKID